MNNNDDIIKIKRILNSKGRQDLSKLINNSRSYLEQSSRFGSKHYSVISRFIVYSPVSNNEKLKNLSDSDKAVIFQVVKLIYPLEDHSPEVRSVEYEVDFENEDSDLIESETLNEVDFEYIHDQVSKCNQKIIEEDFEGAITNSRTLIETVCLCIIEEINGKYDYKGDLTKLYKDVSKALNMMPGDYQNKNIKQILSGVISILNGISRLRNNSSDAHGRSPSNYYKVDKKHATLTVNLSKSISEYIYLKFESWENVE